jgi:hypothetical protein
VEGTPEGEERVGLEYEGGRFRKWFRGIGEGGDAVCRDVLEDAIMVVMEVVCVEL